MIYITGDTHIPIDISKLNTSKFPDQKALSKSDYVIVCGDFGGVWEYSEEGRYWLNWLEQKNFSTLFVDGNHENFDMLDNFCILKMYRGISKVILLGSSIPVKPLQPSNACIPMLLTPLGITTLFKDSQPQNAKQSISFTLSETI